MNYDEIKEPKELGQALKDFFKKKYGIKLSRTRYIKTVRGLMYSWYEISTFRDGIIIPNEFRKKVIEIIMPEAELGNWDNVCYGNIRPQNVCLYGKDWIKLLKELELEETKKAA